MHRDYFVYIVANRLRTTIYIGVTNNSERRIFEHRQGQIKGFNHRYRCHHLVYMEAFRDIRDALAREHQLKNWTRKKKDALIATLNPRWDDLSRDWPIPPAPAHPVIPSEAEGPPIHHRRSPHPVP